jgi:hypothetical protein
MCGGVIVGDIPYEEQDDFRNFVVEVNMSMTDSEIIEKIKFHLDHNKILRKYSSIGEIWAQKYTTKKYVNEFYNQLVAYKQNKTIFIISDEIEANHSELKKEFVEYFGDKIITNNAEKADIIWYLAPWNYKYTPVNFSRQKWLEHLQNKKVIFTMHHIDQDKYRKGELDEIFDFITKYGKKWHAICNNTFNFIKNKANLDDIKIPIVKEYLWVDNNIFYEIHDKNMLRKKWGLSGYIVGSFQKDTEGKTNEPKLSKGPDLFVNIMEDIKKDKPDLLVLLTGVRRNYIIKELEEKNINYKYFEMIGLKELNELYNCLNLYVVSSRVEGGPRAIVEAGITKTPIISTDAGIASDFMEKESIFDMNNWRSYKNAIPNTRELYLKVIKLEKKNQIFKIKNMLEEFV